MKVLFLMILISVLVFSCEKAEYESFRTYPDVSQVARVSLSPNSPVLIADGKAELTFKVKAYMGVEDTRTIEVKNEDEEVILKDSVFTDTIEITADRIPQNEIKIYLEDGTPVSEVFTTTEHMGETLRFKAAVYGVESEVREVRIIEKPKVSFEPITVPIIFHVVYTTQEEYQYESIGTDMLQEILDRLNRVMKNELKNAPSSVDLNVTFVLADIDQYGKALKEKGVNRVKLNDGENKDLYIKSNLVWDPMRYLNVWIGEANEYTIDVQLPRYILDNGSFVQMAQYQDLQKVKDLSDISYWTYKEVGISLNKTHIYRMANASSPDAAGGSGDRFETIIGKFYGLYPTWKDKYNGALDDFCSDTYTYFRIYSRPEKWTYEATATNKEQKNGHEIYFDSFNIMDEHSFCSTITYEQALRMRTVMENCPFRMMRK